MTGFTTKGRQYLDDGAPVPSVTTILQQWPKQLTKWAAQTVAGYAVDHWDELAGLGTAERLRTLEEQVWVKRDAAALRGTQIHAFGEALVAGEPVDVPPEHLGPVQAYAHFLDAWQVTPLVVERPILNRRHNYAGRPDLLALVGAEQIPTLVDIKSGGVYDNQALQLCAYGNAEVYLNAENVERAWQIPEQYAIAHVHSDAVDLRFVDVDAWTFRTFLYTYETWKWAREASQAYKDGRPWPIGPAARLHETTEVAR